MSVSAPRPLRRGAHPTTARRMKMMIPERIDRMARRRALAVLVIYAATFGLFTLWLS